jgi:hypothetical protein
MKRSNPERRAKIYDRNYGEGGRRGHAVRAMPCVCEGHGCWGKMEACHLRPRGLGGCNGDKRELFPACTKHHREQEGRTAAFEERYSLDLREIVTAIAGELDQRFGSE